MEKEEWKTAIIDGKEHEWYSVSTMGRIATHLKMVKNKSNHFSGISYDPNYKKICDYSPEKNKSNRRPKAVRVSLTFPVDFFDDWDYFIDPLSANGRCKRKFSIHKIVMETFRPMDLYPPEKLKDCWMDIPVEAKEWIKQTITINHINHDPTDNRLCNLEYTTQRGNTLAAVNFYGGNFVAATEKNKDNEELPRSKSVLTFL